MAHLAEEFTSVKRAERRKECAEAIDSVVECYEGLLKAVSDFHERVSAQVKNFVTAESQLHQVKEAQLFEEALLDRLLTCGFESIESFNEGLATMIGRLNPGNLILTEKSENQVMFKLNEYLKDLEYKRDLLS